MNKPTRLILACLFACFSFVITNAQSPTPLKPGTPIERELNRGQVHTFTIDLDENNLVQLVVEQKGIDVLIVINSPAGKFLNDYDTPNGPNGPENISFVALTGGTYSLAIEPLESGKTSRGRYEVKIVELRKATEDEVKAKKNEEIAIAKSIDLVRDLEGTIAQVKRAESRIRARIRAANLLWDDDEKRAAKYLADATADLKELIASVDADDPEYQQQYSTIWQIRFEMVQLLGEMDPEAALALLYSTAPPASGLPQEQLTQESNLELTVASLMIKANPKRAYEVARRSLKQGYPSELARVVEELKAKDAELASKLATEIIDKLLNEKLSMNQHAALLTMSMLTLNRFTENSSFTQAHSTLAFKTQDDRYKQLLQKTLDEVLSFSLKSPHGYYNSPAIWSLMHGLKSCGDELDKIISGSSAALDKKYKEFTGSSANTVAAQPLTGSVEEVLETIEQSPTENREQLYITLAQRESSTGQTQRARQIINDFVKTPAQRQQWLNQIEQQEITNAITNGRTEEALRLIGAIRSPSNRAGFLIQLASNFGPGQKRSTALNILEQARALLPASPQAQDGEQLHALIEIAEAFASYDSKRSFEILDPLIDQFNELCVAARTLNGFGAYYFDDEELSQDGNTMSETARQLTSVLGILAFVDFERAKSATDRFRLPDIRLKGYLDIATQIIQGN